MFERAENESAHHDLIERIERAFSDVAYPGDDYIVGTCEHLAVCEECRDLRASFAGRRWTDLIGENEIDFETVGALSLLSPAGWRYYLPAYLISNVREQNYSSMYFRPGDHLEERLERLTNEQFEAFAEYIFLSLKEESESRLSYKSYQKLLNYWKEIYRKKIGRDLNFE